MLKHACTGLVKLSFGVVVGTLLFACNSASTNETSAVSTVKLKTILTHAHCQSASKKIDILTSHAELTKWWSKVSRATLPTPAMPHVLSAVDFAAHSLLIVNLGDKPNPGFGLKLKSNEGQVRNDVLWVSVQETRPVEDAMQLQVLVNPCLVVTARKAGYTLAGIQ